MKRIVLLSVMAVSLLTTCLSHADFRMYSNAPALCQNISGVWNGKGTASNWVIGTCKYHGIGTISTVDDNGHFTLDLDIEKDSGSFLCSDHHKSQFSGTCTNGEVIITTEYGNLSGIFNDNSGSASGSLSVLLGMTVDVSTQFQR